MSDVAEDVALVRRFMKTGGTSKDRQAAAKALARISVQSQGYESIRKELAANYGTDGDPLERVKELLESEEDANGEARVEQDERHRVELERDREATRAEKAEAERDAAVADNAALLDGFIRMMSVFESLALEDEREGRGAQAAEHRRSAENLRRVHAQSHTGAALLERMLALEDVVRTLATGWGGTLRGLADLRAKAHALIATGSSSHEAQPQVEAVLTTRVAALRAHAQMLYESAPPTNSRTSREQVEQWEKAKRIHHELMAAPDAGAELLTELNDHRRNLEVLRDELGAKDYEHVVDALHRWKERLAQAVATIKKMGSYIRSRAGHEENCRGWRKPVKAKSAPAWQRRGEWMDLERCSCGPGALLRLADGALK